MRHAKRAKRGDRLAQRPQLRHDLSVAQRCFRLGLNNPRRNTHAREFLDTEKTRAGSTLLLATPWRMSRRIGTQLAENLMRLHAKPACFYSLRLNAQFMACITAA